MVALPARERGDVRAGERRAVSPARTPALALPQKGPAVRRFVFVRSRSVDKPLLHARVEQPFDRRHALSEVVRELLDWAPILSSPLPPHFSAFGTAKGTADTIH